MNNLTAINCIHFRFSTFRTSYIVNLSVNAFARLSQNKILITYFLRFQTHTKKPSSGKSWIEITLHKDLYASKNNLQLCEFQSTEYHFPGKMKILKLISHATHFKIQFYAFYQKITLSFHLFPDVRDSVCFCVCEWD